MKLIFVLSVNKNKSPNKIMKLPIIKTRKKKIRCNNNKLANHLKIIRIIPLRLKNFVTNAK